MLRWARLRRAVPLEFKLAPWSDTATELGLRPSWRLWSVPQAALDAYFRHGGAAFGHLAREVESSAAAMEAPAGAAV